MKFTSKLLAMLLALALVLSLGTVALADAPLGSEENPEIVTNNGFGFEMGHVMAEGETTYWFGFDADNVGLLNLQITVYEGDPADITVEAVNDYDGSFQVITNQNSAAPFTVWTDDPVLIGISGPVGSDVLVTAVINPEETTPGYVPVAGYFADMNDYTFVAPINPSATVTYKTPMGMGMANWSGKGVIIECVVENPMLDVDAIPDTVVTIETPEGLVEYTDVMEDGDIKFTLPATMMDSPMISISNNSMSYAAATYKVSIVDEAQSECAHDEAQLTLVEAQEHGCHTPTIIEHNECECGELFDLEGNPVDYADVYDFSECENTMVGTYGLHLNDGPDATCTQPGIVDFYDCQWCGGFYLDIDGYEPVTNFNIPATNHKEGLHHNEATASDCGNPGQIENWLCWTCWTYYLDEACTQEADYEDITLQLDYANHSWVVDTSVGDNFDGVLQEHSCTQDGKVQYKCSYGCDDNEGTRENDDLVVTKIVVTPAHDLTYMAEVPVEVVDGEVLEGIKEYWYCETCQKLYGDAAAATEVELADLTIVANGWHQAAGKWYLLENNEYITGWKLVGGTWYYMDENGVMQTGWVLVNGTWYYMNEYGAMQTGWVLLDGTWYYMNAYGAMQTGWVLVNGTWYYMNEYGAMQTGWILLGYTWYYLNEGGAMLANTSITLNGYVYSFNAYGAWVL